jgi:hypothetical protein
MEADAGKAHHLANAVTWITAPVGFIATNVQRRISND